MTKKKIKHYFTIVDYGIKVFNANKGFKINSKESGDWLVFDQRSIRWTKNDLNYLIQIFPHFDELEKIVSWTLYGVVYYDIGKNRYLTDYSPASEVLLDQIALNTLQLLNETYDYVINVKKDEIPPVVELN